MTTIGAAELSQELGVPVTILEEGSWINPDAIVWGSGLAITREQVEAWGYRWPPPRVAVYTTERAAWRIREQLIRESATTSKDAPWSVTLSEAMSIARGRGAKLLVVRDEADAVVLSIRL